jgi:predicted nucleic acid-binding protein
MASSALFVDTSGWANLFDHTAPEHAAFAQAIAQTTNARRTLVTTNYVLAELVALIMSRLARSTHAAMVAFIDGIRNDANVQIEYVDHDLDTEAWNLIVARPDKQWSQVDATSFVLMRRLGITEALTTDHHFTQASFIRIPLP